MWDLILSVPDHCLSFYFENRCCHRQKTEDINKITQLAAVKGDSK